MSEVPLFRAAVLMAIKVPCSHFEPSLHAVSPWCGVIRSITIVL